MNASSVLEKDLLKTAFQKYTWNKMSRLGVFLHVRFRIKSKFTRFRLLIDTFLLKISSAIGKIRHVHNVQGLERGSGNIQEIEIPKNLDSLENNLRKEKQNTQKNSSNEKIN